jgi:copper chaperone NosL
MTTTTLRRWSRLVVLVLLVPFAAACEVAPEPLHVGAEECAHCSMLISDRRYAAQLLTGKGKAYKFDAIECMHAFIGAGTVATGDVHSTWVMDMHGTGDWIPANEASFLQSPGIRSPMGAGLAAFASRAAAEAAAHEMGGEILGWDALLAVTLEHGSTGHGQADHDQGDSGHAHAH